MGQNKATKLNAIVEFFSLISLSHGGFLLNMICIDNVDKFKPEKHFLSCFSFKKSVNLFIYLVENLELVNRRVKSIVNYNGYNRFINRSFNRSID